MSEVTTIGLDIAKSVFHAHAADVAGKQVFSRRISRGKLWAIPRASLRSDLLILDAAVTKQAIGTPARC